MSAIADINAAGPFGPELGSAANRDEAERCLDVCRQHLARGNDFRCSLEVLSIMQEMQLSRACVALNAGNLERARFFAAKSMRMYPCSEATDLLREIDVYASSRDPVHGRVDAADSSVYIALKAKAASCWNWCIYQGNSLGQTIFRKWRQRPRWLNLYPGYQRQIYVVYSLVLALFVLRWLSGTLPWQVSDPRPGSYHSAESSEGLSRGTRGRTRHRVYNSADLRVSNDQGDIGSDQWDQHLYMQPGDIWSSLVTSVVLSLVLSFVFRLILSR